MRVHTSAVVLMALVPACGTAAEVSAIRAGLRVECEGLAIDLLSGEVRRGRTQLYERATRYPPRLEIRDGRTADALEAPTLTEPTATGDKGTCKWQSGDLRGTWELGTTATSIGWSIVIENPGEQQRWLEVTAVLPASLDAPWALWDGLSETAQVTDLVTRQGIAHAFPMVCAYDQERGIALALQPQMLLSHMSVGSEPGRGDRALHLMAQVVVDPGATERVELVIFPFRPRFGWRDALQTYYDLHPAWFQPAEGISAHIFGVGGYLRAGDSRLAWEEARRFGFGWDWGYAPYKKSGDWYPHEEYWEEEYGSIEDYRENMRRQYEVVNRAAAGLSYVNLQFVNVELAQEHFPEALARDAREETVVSPENRIKLDEPVTPAFYWGNPLAEHTMRCFEELAERRGVAGISFDNAMGTGMRYGPGPENSPGRAFGKDPDAVWAAEGIAMAKQMEKVHTLSNGRHRLMVFANGPRCFLTCFRADGAMHEASPYTSTDILGAMRRLMGHKPMICWEDHPEHELDWERMTPEELREALRGDYDFWVMYGLRYGILPSAQRLRGNRILQRHLDELLAVVRAGWQPVPAMRSKPDLWLGRFGVGIRTLLTIGNATGKDVQASVEVDSSYLGEGAYAFVPFDGEAGLKSEMFGQQTLVRLPVANRATRALRAALCLKGIREAAATCEAFPVAAEQPATVRWTLTAPRGGSAELEHWLPEGVVATAARVAGTACEFEQTDGAVSFSAELPGGEPTTVEVDFVPVVIIADRERVLGFPFLDAHEPACSIVCADGADEDTRFAAERIAVYFEYWTAAQQKPGATAATLAEVEGRAQIPVVSASAADPARPMVRVSTYAGKLCLPPEGLRSAGYVGVAEGEAVVLDVAGRDGEAVNAAALALMRLLDQKYEYYGLMGVGDPLLQRAEVAGRVFD